MIRYRCPLDKPVGPYLCTMSLSLDQVLRVARLARISIGTGEAEAVAEQLNRVLRLIDQMRAAQTDGVEPMAHARDVVLRLRDDVVTETDRRAALQSVAPRVEGGLYLVPKVIE